MKRYAHPGRLLITRLAVKFRPSIVLVVAIVPMLDVRRDMPPIQESYCRVKRVSDGDSFVCGDGRRVRLLLIDAPELQQGEFGRRSRRQLEKLLPVESVVSLTFDVRKRDRNHRLLAYVRRDTLDVNREMVRSGMAVVLVYPPNVARVDVMRAAADSARREKRGLWAGTAFECLPVNYRARRCK